MARTAKKETALTAEEKLAQALVPESEQPYQVPANWCWVHLSGLLREIKNGTTIKQDKSGEGYSVTRIESLQNQTIDFNRLGTIIDRSEIKETDWYIAGDIALSHINSAEHVGKTALISEAMLPLVHGMNLLRLRFTEALSPLLFQYYSQSFQYKDAILARINMAVNQVSINQKQIGTIEFPLPPLAEQQRIVDHIESLFVKLDEAKEKAQAVVDGFEDRRAAILHKAFTGVLTKQWRESHGLSLSSWDALPFGELAKDVRLGLVRGKVEQSTDKQYGYLKMNNITTDGLVDLDGLVRVDATVDEVSTYSLYPGDFLFNTRNSFELVGKNAVWQFSEVKNMLFNNNIMRVRFHDRVLPQYVCHFFNSAEGKRDLEIVKKNTTNIAAIYAKDLNKIRIPLPQKEEQEQICLIVSSIINSLQAAKEAAEQVIDQIDTMKKAILARAFRGELGTNDPADESAEELLKRVLS